MVRFKTVQITDLTEEDLQAMGAQDQLIDVREADEYEAGHIEDALNYPLSTLNTKFPLDQGKTYYIYCQKGGRSQQASQMLSDSGFDVINLNGGYEAYLSQQEAQAQPQHQTTSKQEQTEVTASEKTIKPERKQLNYSGLQCPGPIVNLRQAIKQLQPGEQVEVIVTDLGFASDIQSWAKQTGHHLIDLKTDDSKVTAIIEKGEASDQAMSVHESNNGTTIVLFSGELDKALAALIIANGARAAGREVSIFFTFWGLNALKRTDAPKVQKKGLEKLFDFMLPKGPESMPLSKMNMFGLGRFMMKLLMKQKNVDSLPALIDKAIENDIKLIACTMSMDVMGIKREELRDDVQIGGVGTYIGDTEHAKHNLFI
ncbi:DsrE/DsrF/DrsH-like family protein [Staphylococcus simulans]|uniref:DsrE/DsrF/DrsH-like family protein n=1 Tax=Staphylococcus simulans TaxID=1286 RepID=UPI000E68A7ED|nr:DsrE/DsrF/DrsH-like family protein [Staphylococcus simulans]RIN55065.1 dihydroneopterin aldolase [Staphylococcus simulans]